MNRQIQVKRYRNGGNGFQSEGVCPYEEKEQFSPVSVLDFPDEEEDDDDGETETPSSFHQSLANMERAKQKLMQKVRRFECLAQLEPMDLEKRIALLKEDDDSGESPSQDDLLPVSQESEDEQEGKVEVEAKVAEGEKSCGEMVTLGLEYNWEAYVREMESEGGKWRKFEEEQSELVAEIERGVLGSLVNELLIDLFS